MPQITKATLKRSGPANSRLEFDIEAVIDNDDANPVTWTFNVSDNKHCIDSYKTGGATPSAAPVGTPNTLVNMSTADFAVAFADYGRLMAVKLLGKDPGTFDPSEDTNRIKTKGIAFVSDRNSLNANVHCFPVHISDTQTPKSVEFSFAQFNHLKTLTKYLYRHAGGQLRNQVTTAQTAWAAMRAFFDGLKDQENEMLTPLEIEMLDVRLGAPAATPLAGYVRTDATDIHRKAGMDDGKAATGAYRSTG